MIRTIEAMIDADGSVRLLESISLDTSHRALVTILDEIPTEIAMRPSGLCSGEFVVPEDFDDPLPAEILATFEGP